MGEESSDESEDSDYEYCKARVGEIETASEGECMKLFKKLVILFWLKGFGQVLKMVVHLNLLRVLDVDYPN